MPEKPTLQAALDESALVRAVGRGDERSMDKLYRTHADAIFRFIYRRVEECYEDAEEITQETFLSVLDLAPSFGGRSSVFVWLCGIAKLRIVDFYRSKGRDKRVPAKLLVDLDDSLAAGGRDTFLDRVNHAMLVDRLAQELSDEEREAFLMRHVEELSLGEMSELLGRSERAVEGLVYRAKTRLRNTVCEWWGDTERS